MSGYYVLKSTTNGKFSFTLKAGNHEVILTSQIYESRESAKNGISSVQAHGPKKESFEKRTSAQSEPYFVLKSANGQIIGNSEMYSTASACDGGIASVMANSPSTIIKEE